MPATRHAFHPRRRIGLRGEAWYLASFSVALWPAPLLGVAGSGRSTGASAAPVVAVLAFLAAVALAVWAWRLRRQLRAYRAEMTMAQAKLRRCEEELAGSLQRERELGDLRGSFVSLVSHEFRTPLAVILSSVEILRNHFDRLGPETRRQQLDAVISSTQHMARLIESVMVLGRMDGGRLRFNPAPVDVAAFCTLVRDEVASATHMRNPLKLSITGISQPANVDESLLHHILTNLLTNAIKYSPPGATVDFRVRKDGFELVVEVEDRGIGIPDADHARIFEAFHRAANVGAVSGSGLGLVIVKRCVDLHSGEVAFRSQPGKGTAFTVRLPGFLIETAVFRL